MSPPRLVERRTPWGAPWFFVEAVGQRPGGWTDGHPWRAPSKVDDPGTPSCVGRRIAIDPCPTCGGRVIEYIEGDRVCTRSAEHGGCGRAWKEPAEVDDYDWRAAEAARHARPPGATAHRGLRLRQRVAAQEPVKKDSPASTDGSGR